MTSAWTEESADVIESAVLHLQPAEAFTKPEDTHKQQCFHPRKQRLELSATKRVTCSDYPRRTVCSLSGQATNSNQSPRTLKGSGPPFSSHELGLMGLVEIAN